MKTDLDAIKIDCVSVSSILAQIELELFSLYKEVGLIEKFFTDFKDNIVRLFVAKVLESKKAEFRGMSHLNQHIKHTANDSKMKLDESKGDNQGKSSESGTSQSLVILCSKDGKAIQKLSAQVMGLHFFFYINYAYKKY